MCGITGVVSKINSISVKDMVFKMSRAIQHRGPDGEGFAFFSEEKSTAVFSDHTPLVNIQSSTFKFNPSLSIENVDINYKFALAHRRLSIIDLSEAGHQPMCDTSEKYWISFNGEIYNYIELKEELQNKGHVFVTHSDTEVIIEAYKEWGVNCLQKFNGMWAFSLFDKKNNQLFCARDRVGVKPFYYVNSNHCFAFSSEYKAFIKSKLIPFEINERQQFDFLVNVNLENDEESLFKNIKELKPSHFIIYNLASHQLDIKKYYTLPSIDVNQKSDSEIIERIEHTLINAINIRLRSDVEIGSCLSGGLDSSIIAGVIKHLQPNHQLKLFTAVFPNNTFDESHYAKLVADYVNGSWKNISPTADDFFRDIEKLNYYQDIPVWSTSTYSQHRVMQLASENNIKVVLDGQGADELFAGYSHHYMALWKEQLFSLNLNKLITGINQSSITVPHAYKLFGKQLIKDEFNLSVDYNQYFNKSQKYFGKSKNIPLMSTLNEQLKTDYQGKLKSFLKCEDRCSMAFGIESRVPFADDVELVDFIFSVSGNKKIQNGISKYLLREATKKYIPQQIYNRKDKIGFETPVAEWFLPHKSQVIEVINSQLDFVNKSYLTNNYETLIQYKPTFLLRLYSLAIWKRIFSDL